MSHVCTYCNGSGYHRKRDVSVDALCFCQDGRDERAHIYSNQNMPKPTSADLLNIAMDERDKRMKIEGRKCCCICDNWFTPDDAFQKACNDCKSYTEPDEEE